MLTRRIIRVKVFQTLYAFRQQDNSSLLQAHKDLDHAFQKMYEMYLFQLQLPTFFDTFLQSLIDSEKEKYFPSEENIRSAGIFSNNEAVNLINDSSEFTNLSRRLPFSWLTQGEMFDKVFKALRREEFFIDYLVFENPSFEQKKEFLQNFYSYLYRDCEMFSHAMEEMYIHWDDDDEHILKVIHRTIDLMQPEEPLSIDPFSMNEIEDMEFAHTLIEKTLSERQYLEHLVSSNTINWDPDRIAMSDFIILQMSLAEFLYFPYIPVKVTINEALDISKMYSTPRSSAFVNGILDRIRIKLTDEGLVLKKGRGLKDHS